MTAHQLQILIGVAGALWIAQAAGVAYYARTRGFPWFPIFLSALFIGFPLVLLAVTVAGTVRAGPLPRVERVPSSEAQRMLAELRGL